MLVEGFARPYYKLCLLTRTNRHHYERKITTTKARSSLIPVIGACQESSDSQTRDIIITLPRFRLYAINCTSLFIFFVENLKEIKVTLFVAIISVIPTFTVIFQWPAKLLGDDPAYEAGRPRFESWGYFMLFSIFFPGLWIISMYLFFFVFMYFC